MKNRLFSNSSLFPQVAILWAGILGTSSAVNAQNASNAQNQAKSVVPATSPRPFSLPELNRFMGGPSLVTIHLQKATPQTVIAQLKQQLNKSGINLHVIANDNRANSRIDVEMTDRPLWLALRDIAPKIGLLTPSGTFSLDVTQKGAINLAPVGAMYSMTGPTFQSGPCLFVANGIRHERTASISPGLSAPAKTEEEIRFDMGVFLDPKLQYRVLLGEPQLQQALDDQGHPLVFDAKGQKFKNVGLRTAYSTNFPFVPLDLTAYFRAAPNLGKRISTVKGTVGLHVLTQSETWEISDILNTQNALRTQAFPGGAERYEVMNAQQEGKKYVVQLKISRQHSQALFSDNAARWLWSDDIGVSTLSLLRLLDAKGREIGPLSFSMTSFAGASGSERVTATAAFEASKDGTTGEPVELVWTLPTEFRPVAVPFHFNNVPLP